MKNLNVRSTLVAVGLAIAMPLPVFSAELEEIVITARKREESLQDVPIALQAVSGGQIAEQGIVDLQQLAPYTPNFSYIQAAGASDLYFMRGLGTFGSGIHFEPSIGQVFNGFFSTRSRLGRSALIDVAQVEVLKGPQGAIIGKNTSLGAINITSNRPTEEFEGSLSAQYNFDASEGYEVEGIVSGPFSDSVRGRAVINYRDVDGWVDNTVTGDSNRKAEDLTLRLMLDIDLSETVDLGLMYQRTDYDHEGKARIITGCPEFQGPAGPPQTMARAESLGLLCTKAAQNSTVDFRRDANGNLFNSNEPFTLESDFFSATLSFEFENFTVTSLTGITEYDIADTFSGDQINAERVSINNDENFEQLYQEIRIVGSAPSDAFDYIAGITYFDGELDAFQAFHGADRAVGPPIPDNVAVSRNEFQASQTDSKAIFGQIDWHLSEQFTLTAGLRYTDESREGSKAQIVGEVYTSNLAAAPVPCNVPFIPLSACTNGDGTPVTGEIDDQNTSYNVSLQYMPSEDHRFYVTGATGFKSGGFDLRGAGNPNNFVFGEEETTNFEIGGKHYFLDNSMRFNWTIFSTEVEDLQVSANDPVLIQQVVAAADATSEGIELDMLWATPVEGLTLNFVGSYTDATYDEFFGSCYLGQVASPATIVNGSANGCDNVGVAVGNFTGVQDLAGETLPLAPEISYVIGADYSMPVGDIELTASAKYIYIDEQFMSIERDPLGFQGSTGRVDASLVLRGNPDSDNEWTLALIGRNLNDELVHTFVNASTLSSAAVVTSNLEETRSISLRASMSF